MSTNKTENLNLHSWVETDPVKMSEFNENFNALDAMAATLSDSISAEARARSEQINSVNTTLTNQINSHAAAAASTFGNCRIITGSYVGTGQCGKNTPNTLHFSFAPKWLIIVPQSNTSYTGSNLDDGGYLFINLASVKHAIENNTNGYSYQCLPGLLGSSNYYAVYISLADDGKTVSWYGYTQNDPNGTTYEEYQANRADFTYFYTAIA